MPTGSLPANNYLGDGQRTTSEFQTGIDQLLAYANSLKAEVDALSATIIKEAAVRGVGTGATDLVQTSQLDTRLGTSGNLGGAAQRTVGTADGNLPEYESEVVTLGGIFNASQQVKCVRIGDCVTIFGLGDQLNHSSSIGGAGSDAGDIPLFARPAEIVTNVYFGSSQLVATAYVFPDGTFSLDYGNTDGTTPTRSDSVTPPTITFLAQ